MQKKQRVLFVCIHNSARSQMAEAFLAKYGGARFDASSAGLEPGKLNPRVVAVMQEDGIDISGKKTTAVSDLLRNGESYEAVITVCDGASAEKCPLFPGEGKRIAWFFSDPSSFKGTEEEILTATRLVRDEIKEKILAFIKESDAPGYRK